MYELIKISENDYYIDCPAKIGLCRINENEVVLIDSGSDKDAGKKALKVISENGWTLKAVYNTHSHADHIGGNRLIQDRTGVQVYAPGIENAFTVNPILEPMMLYGGMPFKDIENKFLKAQESSAMLLTPDVLPEGWEILELPGHSMSMAGFRTKDNNLYIGDCVSSEATLKKYGIGYLYDPEAYVSTLEMLKEEKCNMFVPSHAEATYDISELADINIRAVLEVQNRIHGFLCSELTFEELLKKIFESYNLEMNAQQYLLIGSTVRSYLSYLKKEGRVQFIFSDNRMLWYAI